MTFNYDACDYVKVCVYRDLNTKKYTSLMDVDGSGNLALDILQERGGVVLHTIPRIPMSRIGKVDIALIEATEAGLDNESLVDRLRALYEY